MARWEGINRNGRVYTARLMGKAGTVVPVGGGSDGEWQEQRGYCRARGRGNDSCVPFTLKVGPGNYITSEQTVLESSSNRC